MKNLFYTIISFLSLFLPQTIFSQNINGSWEGKLSLTPEISLRFVLNIKNDNISDKSVTMDSPDQGAYGIPLTIDFLTEDSISVSAPQLFMNYKGTLQGDSITGKFTQSGLNLPLVLHPKSPVRRPQTPVAPYSYKTEEILFHSTLDNSPLYGVLTTPMEHNDDTPVVILISGSGTQNRDEEIFDHKPFAVIADYLANYGIASLRYDDRGYVKSTGLQPNSTTYENAKDAEGAVNFLRNRGYRQIGLIGHSEGGLIADMLASERDDINFIIEIGGPAVSGDKILLFQNEYLLREGKMPEQYIKMYIDAMAGLLDSQKNTDPVPFVEANYEIFSEKWKDNPVINPLVKNLQENFYNLAPWLKSFINYDPSGDLQNIKIPIFMIYGEKDIQVPPSLNAEVITNNFPDIKVKVYPRLNHLMQHSVTGNITEYAEIEETISPEVLEDIKNFILLVEK